MKFMKAKRWADTYFEPDSRPDNRTVYAWIDEGIIPGRRFGREYYVDIAALEAQPTGHPVADRILSASNE